jgi:hypothetical protein
MFLCNRLSPLPARRSVLDKEQKAVRARDAGILDFFDLETDILTPGNPNPDTHELLLRFRDSNATEFLISEHGMEFFKQILYYSLKTLLK